MIVKDEEHCILDCLKNVENCIDAVVIVDTGSKDKTREIIKDFCQNKALPCVVHDDHWDSNFGRSRTLALKEAVKFAQGHETNYAKYSKLGPLTPNEFNKMMKSKNNYYAFFMDADNRLFKEDGKEGYKLDKSKLVGDLINVKMRQSVAHYDYVWMVKLDIFEQRKWKWFEPLHEYVATQRGWIPSKQEIKDCYIISGRFGARSKNPYKYLDDAHVFRKALKTDPYNERYMYYMGQSYRDAGEFKDALAAFEKRGEMTQGYESERYVALVEAAKLCRALEPEKVEKFIFLLLRAINCNPHRLEAPYHLCRFYRLSGQFNLGYHICASFIDKPYPASELFIDHEIHKWKFYDELAICSFYAGFPDLCKKLSSKALEYNGIPYGDRSRIERNMQF